MFLSPTPWSAIEATCAVRLRLTGKRVVDFLLVTIEPFSLNITGKMLLANID